MLERNISKNEKGHLLVGGCDTVALAKQYGTPLYIMDEERIEKICLQYTQSLQKYYPAESLVLFASKSFCCMEMCRVIQRLGIGLDVSSSGEIFTAFKAGFTMQKVYFHGNNKTKEEIDFAIKANIGRFVVDNIYELELINTLAEQNNCKVKILYRIKPGIDAHTHDFIKTGQIDSKFGVALETGEAAEFACLAASYKCVDLVGVHCHIGSQIFDCVPFEAAAELMVNFVADIRDSHGITLSELNLGGGIGIKYTAEDNPKEIFEYISALSGAVVAACERRGIPLPLLILEPGRSISAPAGTTLYEVGAVKHIEGVRDYLLIDGGMNDNPRYALYRAKYTFELANKILQPKNNTYTIAGRTCESGDLLGENISLQQACKGDILAVLATGAYNYSMSNNYNRFPKPPVVMVKNGSSRVIVKRESLTDLLRNDL